MIVASPAREQTRARYPDEEGFVEVEGVRIFWERYGHGAQTILFTPTWELVHSRCWKMQVPYFARHGRVVTFDPPGNGRSDRPRDAAAYERSAVAEYAAAVLDAARVERAVVVSWCDMGEALVLAAEHPERVSGAVFIAPALPVGEPEVAQFPFDEELDTDEGWAKENRHYWLRDWRGYVEFFISKMFTEPHSTKQIEDCVGWGLETDAETLLVSFRGWDTKELDPETTVELSERVRCPVLVVHGTEDELVEPERARAFASELGAHFVLLEGSGHGPHARDPVKINGLVRDFTEPIAPPKPKARNWTRALSRRKRALYISSPIGLGHAQRDAAIADELRKLHPDLEIDWLA